MSGAAKDFRFLSGVNAASAGFVVSELARGDAPLAVVVAAHLGRAEVLAEDAAFFAENFSDGAGGGFTVCGLPRMTDESVGAASFENECDLLAALATLKNARPGERVLLACTPEALRRPVPAPDAFAARELVLRVGEKFSMDALREKLSSEFNYDNEALCEAPGQFSVRGGLIDVYPLNASAPVRVDFFGDEVEAIREFDPTTQRTLRRLESVAVASGALASADEAPRAGTPADYFPAGTRLIFAEAEAFAGAPPEELLSAARERSRSVSRRKSSAGT